MTRGPKWAVCIGCGTFFHPSRYECDYKLLLLDSTPHATGLRVRAPKARSGVTLDIERMVPAKGLNPEAVPGASRPGFGSRWSLDNVSVCIDSSAIDQANIP